MRHFETPFTIVGNTLQFIYKYKPNFRKMSKLRALSLAVKKWDFIAANSTLVRYGFGAASCALCQKYMPNPGWRSEKDCVDCPVRESTGEKYCIGTPFDYVDMIDYVDMTQVTDTERKAVAIAERDFLLKLVQIETSRRKDGARP